MIITPCLNTRRTQEPTATGNMGSGLTFDMLIFQQFTGVLELALFPNYCRTLAAARGRLTLG